MGLLDFTQWEAISFASIHTELPVICLSLYFAFLHVVPGYIRPGKGYSKELKIPFALWNLTLSLFSIGGSIDVIPALYRAVTQEGWHYSICADGYWFKGPEEYQCWWWVILFAYSKYFELMDTVFLILRGKKVIFLHWFHHATVLMFVTNGLILGTGGAMWFCAMNYFIHSIMYTYYFLTNVGLYTFVRPIAPLITFLQIAQMVGGLIVTMSMGYMQLQAVGWSFLEDEAMRQKQMEACHIEPSYWKNGFLMYLSYFILFVLLFLISI